VGVGDDQLDAAQAAPGELAQEGGPERLRLRRADVEAQHLPPAVGVDADRDDHGDGHDAAVLPNLHVGGVDPPGSPRGLPRGVAQRYGQSPSSERSRNAFTLASSSSQSRLTWDFETPSIPIDRQETIDPTPEGNARSKRAEAP
jgi:hypothetical protein